MIKVKPVTVETNTYELKLSSEQFQSLIGGEPRDVSGDLETYGPWQLPVRFKAVCVHREWKDGFVSSVTFFGPRTLGKLKQADWHLEGRCKVGGKEVRGHTCSIMVDVDGSLYTVGVISITKG